MSFLVIVLEYTVPLVQETECSAKLRRRCRFAVYAAAGNSQLASTVCRRLGAQGFVREKESFGRPEILNASRKV